MVLITIPQNVSDKRVYLKKITDPNDTLVSRRVGYLAYTAQFDIMQRKTAADGGGGALRSLKCRTSQDKMHNFLNYYETVPLIETTSMLQSTT